MHQETYTVKVRTKVILYEQVGSLCISINGYKIIRYEQRYFQNDEEILDSKVSYPSGIRVLIYIFQIIYDRDVLFVVNLLVRYNFYLCKDC